MVAGPTNIAAVLQGSFPVWTVYAVVTYFVGFMLCIGGVFCGGRDIGRKDLPKSSNCFAHRARRNDVACSKQMKTCCFTFS